ncbi:MAG: hypothetical protein M3308_05185 [Actinomycetota bacterium]|nr:hypothetical protein [Actinomycetota bacterium]
MFGIRLSTTLIRQGAQDPAALAAEPVRRSGLDELCEVLATQFTERRDLLKARSALLALDQVLRNDPRPDTTALVGEVERILAGVHEFAELRLLSALKSGAVTIPAAAAEEAERLLGGMGNAPVVRLGVPATAGPDEVRGVVLDALTRWQRRAENPMSSRAAADASRVVVRSLEGILRAVGSEGLQPTESHGAALD